MTPPSGRPRKHSVLLQGHQTSVSLEDEFWQAFQDIAAQKGLSLNALAAQIDEARGIEAGLASAIRVYVLRHYQAQLAAELVDPQSNG